MMSQTEGDDLREELGGKIADRLFFFLRGIFHIADFHIIKAGSLA